MSTSGRSIQRGVAAVLVISGGLVACAVPPAPTGLLEASPDATVSIPRTRPAGEPAEEESVETQSISAEPWPADEFWAQLTPGQEGLFRYRSLSHMIRSTTIDVVVVGHARSVEPGRADPLPTPDDPRLPRFGYGTLAFEVDQVLSGRLHDGGGRVINVEFFMSDPALFPRFAAAIPDERVILFLENKGQAAVRDHRDPNGPFGGFDFYDVPSFEAYFRDVDGRVASAIPKGGPTGDHERWVQDQNGLDFEKMLTLIRGDS